MIRTNQEDLQIRLKVEEMIQYGYAALRQFPKSEKHVLSAEIRRCMIEILRLDSEQWLRENLELSTNRKTSVFPVSHGGGRGLDFLGYHLWPHARRLRKASLRRFGRQLKQWQADFSTGSIELSDIEENMHSWLNHARHGNAVPAIVNMVGKATFRRSPDGYPRPNARRRNSSRNPRRVGAQKAA